MKPFGQSVTYYVGGWLRIWS